MSLSDKIGKHSQNEKNNLSVINVKEFIKELKNTEIDLIDLGVTHNQGVKIWNRMNKFIDKLAGDKLK